MSIEIAMFCILDDCQVGIQEVRKIIHESQIGFTLNLVFNTHNFIIDQHS